MGRPLSIVIHCNKIATNQPHGEEQMGTQNSESQ